MDEPRIWFEPDLVARLEIVPLAKDGGDLLAADFGGDLNLGTCWLHHDDLAWRAVVGQREMLDRKSVV